MSVTMWVVVFIPYLDGQSAGSCFTLKAVFVSHVRHNDRQVVKLLLIPVECFHCCDCPCAITPVSI